jgi:hypothetical protein
MDVKDGLKLLFGYIKTWPVPVHIEVYLVITHLIQNYCVFIGGEGDEQAVKNFP